MRPYAYAVDPHLTCDQVYRPVGPRRADSVMSRNEPYTSSGPSGSLTASTSGSRSASTSASAAGSRAMSTPSSTFTQTQSTTSTSDYLSPEDDWRAVEDPVRRRQIQNRLAQREYRKKSKQKKEESERAAQNERRASGAYVAPEAEDFQSEGQESGLPWGTFNMGHVITAGKAKEERESSSRRLSEYAATSRAGGSSRLGLHLIDEYARGNPAWAEWRSRILRLTTPQVQTVSQDNDESLEHMDMDDDTRTTNEEWSAPFNSFPVFPSPEYWIWPRAGSYGGYNG